MARVRRSYSGEGVVDADANIQFGVEHFEPGTGVPGHPETQVRYIGVERDFDVERLVIEVDDPAHYEVMRVGNVFCGAEPVFRLRESMLARWFAPDADPVQLSGRCPKGFPVGVPIVTTSPSPIRFRARVEGREDDEAPTDTLSPHEIGDGARTDREPDLRVEGGFTLTSAARVHLSLRGPAATQALVNIFERLAAEVGRRFGGK